MSYEHCLNSALTSVGWQQRRGVVDGAACRTAAAASSHTVQPRWFSMQQHARLLNTCFHSRHSGPGSRDVAHSACAESRHLVCLAASEHSEQQLWLPKQHQHLLQQLQEPAEQLQRALGAQQQPATAHKHAACIGSGMPGRHSVVGAAAASSQNIQGADEQRASLGSNSSSSSSKASSGSGSSSLSKVMRERMRQRVATRLTQSASPNQAAAPDEAASVLAPPPLPSDALASTAEAATASSRGGVQPQPVQSNDSSIGDILQQLQQKLGPQFSKPGSAAQPLPAPATSSNGINSSSAAHAKPAVDGGSGAADGRAAAAAASRRRNRQQQLLLLKEQERSVRSKQQQRAKLKEQKAAAFQQLQAAADVFLKQRPPAASASSSKVSEPNRMSSSSKASGPSSRRTKASSSTAVSSNSSSTRVRPPSQPRTRRRASDSVVTADTPAQEAAAAGAAQADDLGPLPPGVAAVVASTAAPVEVQRQLLRSLVAGHGVPRNSRILARRLMHFDQASQLLGGPERAAGILQRDSSLLLMAPAVLQRKLKHMQQLLSSSAPAEPAAAAADVGSSAGSTPEVAEPPAPATAGQRAGNSSSSSSSSGGDSAYHVSGEVLGLLRSHPGLLRLSAAGLEQRLTSLQAALGLASKQEVLQVVRWQPRVLSMSEATLQDKVWGLAAALRVPPASVQSLFVRQPLLLNLSADTLGRKASSLSSSLGLPPQQLWEMLQCKPGVLLFSSAKVLRKWTGLKRLAASHPRWRAELAELSPSSLVQLLTASDPRLARLQHVAAVGLQEEQSLYYTAAQQTDARFRAKFKQYGRWLLEQKRRGAAGAGGTAAAAAAGSP